MSIGNRAPSVLNQGDCMASCKFCNVNVSDYLISDRTWYKCGKCGTRNPGLKGGEK